MDRKQGINIKGKRPVYYKSIGVTDFKADKESRTVSGYLAAFGNVDSDGDMLVRGCFAKSIAERGPGSKTHRKIAFLWMHDMKDPIGHFTKLVEDDKGLYFEAYVDDIPQGNRALTQYESGTLDQHSIGYKYIWDKCSIEDVDGEQVFVCTELALWEGSVVSLGANEDTQYEGLKAEEIESKADQLAKETEDLIKDLDPVIGYRVRQNISKHIALAEAVEPGKPLDNDDKPQQTDWTKVLNAIKKSN